MYNETRKFCGNPVMETERLVLRRFEVKDAQDVFEYAMQPEVVKYVVWEAHKSVDDSEKYIKGAIERYKKDEAGEWVIELKQEGKVIGAIGFVQLDVQNSCGTIGYVLSKRYWSQGIMTEAVKRIIRFGFDDMKLNRIEALHMPENEASGRVMQKVGMTYEGLLRQRVLAKGKFCDTIVYSIVKDEM